MAGDSGVKDVRDDLAQRLAGLSPAKRALLERALTGERVDGALDARPTPTIPPRDTGTSAPLSYEQELVWMLERTSPGYGYNVPRAARLRGPLDVAALRRALDTILARHEVLRSTFELVAGEPRQIVHPPRPVPLVTIDLTDVPAAERDGEAVRRVRELARRPFDLERDLQLRATVLVLDGDDHVVLLESHHISSDAWSRNILLRELATLYAGYRAGTEPALPPLAIQYGDFAAWQRRTLAGERLERLLAYWRERLVGVPAALELPTDRPRPVTPTFEGATLGVTLPMRVLEGVRRLSRQRNATVFMALLAAFDVLLARYSGQDDIVVGSPIAGRSIGETEGVIGYFMNTLVMRTSLAGDPTFTELLARVRETCLGAYDHQDVPFEKLVMELQRAERSAQALQLQALFTLHDAEREQLRLEGSTLVPFAADRGAAKFDVSFVAQERADGLRAALEYRTDRFDAGTVQRMLVHLSTLLDEIIADPERPISQLSMLPAEERALLLEERNRTAAPIPEPALIHELVAQQAARTPGAIAVEDDARRLTYAELERHANILARRLRAHGVRGGDTVGVAMARSPELIVSLLAVLKAGATYVPIAPEYPAARVAYMLENARVRVLLTRVETTPTLPAHDADVIVLDEPGASLLDESAADPGAPTGTGVTPDVPAYVIYTSGSTGQPKGVIVPHRAVVNYIHWMRVTFPQHAGDAVLLKAPVSFDASVLELYLPLFTGARLVLAPADASSDPAVMLETLARHEVTNVQFVPSQLQLMLQVGGMERLTKLRQLFCGGEALPAELLARIIETLPRVEIANLYGPTETTVYSTWWRLDRDAFDGSAPIGRPIFNTRVYVLDANQQPVPVGLPGELYIGGTGVAHGYLRRPELTAERFLPDPFATERGARMYRTGDRVRWRADGVLEYLGRFDTQVKVRGFRVEIGEIESVLASHPAVRESVVIARAEPRTGTSSLAAYYCMHAGAALTTAELRAWLRERLPAYMVPSALVCLPALPMNSNGKLDRRALPEPAEADAGTVDAYVPPRTATETLIAEAWREVLGHDRIGATSDFFDLGGHSLAAMQIMVRLSALFRAPLTMRHLFEHPTVADLAATIAAQEPKPGYVDSLARAVLKLRTMSPEERAQLKARGRGA